MKQILTKAFSFLKPKPKTITEEFTSFIKEQPIITKGAKQYKKIVKSPIVSPTVGLFKGAKNVGVGLTSLALKQSPLILGATVAYELGAYLTKKRDPGLEFPEMKQFDKRGRKIY